MNSESYNLIAVVGPTASGKTAFAARMSYELNGEIISADSRQIYRRMDIGTGKDLNDYFVMGRRIPVHLIDIAEPGYKYSVFEYQRDFFNAFQKITAEGKIPVLCGGSGMYINAAVQKYRLIEVPENNELRDSLKGKSLNELAAILAEYKTLHNTTDIDTVEHAIRAIEIQQYYREHNDLKLDVPQIRPVFLGIIFDRQIERERITKRLHSRLKEGLVEEVKNLLDSGISAESLAYYGLEYRYVTNYLTGKIDYEEMVGLLNTAIHQFAKRQRTWFRRMEREGCKIHWIQGELSMERKLVEARRVLFDRV